MPSSAFDVRQVVKASIRPHFFGAFCTSFLPSLVHRKVSVELFKIKESRSSNGELHTSALHNMSLADYLAKNYLSADKPDKKSKKRKRKGTDLNTATTGLTIADDDLTGFGNSNTNGNASDDDDPTISGYIPVTTKTTTWKRIGVAAPKDRDQEAADAIIAAAARENQQALEAEDAPVIEDLNRIGATDALVGLRTGAEVTAHINAKKAADRKRYKEDEAAGKNTGKGSETIYRDASGRVINVAKKKAEAAAKQQEEDARKKLEAENAKGDVQRQQAAENRQALSDAKFMTLARHADDVEMNEEMKEKERWNDPAMGFVTAKKKNRSKSGKPLYQGAFEPNRYGIRPGYRWDGVDRGIGFEKKWFAARNRQRDRKELEYAWQMDE